VRALVIRERREADVRVDPQAESLDTFQKLLVYRIAYGAVANTVRHGKATALSVELAQSTEAPGSSRCRLSVADNGCGFDLASVDDESFGLRSMKQRAKTLGGELKIKSDRQGTRISVEFS